MNGVDALIICLDRIANVLERLAERMPVKNGQPVEHPKEETPFPWHRVPHKPNGIRSYSGEIPNTIERMAEIGRREIKSWRNVGKITLGAIDAIMLEHGYGNGAERYIWSKIDQ